MTMQKIGFLVNEKGFHPFSGAYPPIKEKAVARRPRLFLLPPFHRLF
jgi:hypothetical protein